MTCLEKWREMYPDGTASFKDEKDVVDNECASSYGIMPDPIKCGDCMECWNRMLPESSKAVTFMIFSTLWDGEELIEHHPCLKGFGCDGKTIMISSLDQLMALQKAVNDPIIVDATGSIHYKAKGPAIEIYDGYRE